MPDPRFSFVGGTLCLDFCNTMIGRRTASPADRVSTFDELVSFVRQAGVATPAEAAALRALGERRPDEAARVSARARALRDTLYRVFGAVAERRDPEPADIDRVSAETAAFAKNRRLRRDGGRYRWVCESPDGDLAWPLSAIVMSACELLTQADLSRVRACEADDCASLFFDSSKNRSRRWCDMAECGNRAKARAFYRRQRGTA